MKSVIYVCCSVCLIATVLLEAGPVTVESQYLSYGHDSDLVLSSFYDDGQFYDNQWEQLDTADLEFSQEWFYAGEFEGLSVPDGSSLGEYESVLSSELSSRFRELGEGESALEMSFETTWSHFQLCVGGEQRFQYDAASEGDYELVLSEPTAIVLSLSAEFENLLIADDAWAAVDLRADISGERQSKRVGLIRDFEGVGFQVIDFSAYGYIELEPGNYRFSVSASVSVDTEGGAGLLLSEGLADISVTLLARSLSVPGLPVELSMTVGSESDAFVLKPANLPLGSRYELQGSPDLRFLKPRSFGTIRRTELFPQLEVDTSELGAQYFFRLVEAQ